MIKIKFQILEIPLKDALALLISDSFKIVMPVEEYDVPENTPIDSIFDFPGITVTIKGENDGRSYTESDNIENKILRNRIETWLIFSKNCDGSFRTNNSYTFRS